MDIKLHEKIIETLITFDGIKRSELAERLGIHRSQISRVLEKLIQEYPITEDDDRKLYLQKEKMLSSIKLNIHEIVALFLSVRMLANELNIYDQYSASVLQKMALCIDKLAPEIARQIRNSAEHILTLYDRCTAGKMIHTLHSLSMAWLNKQKVYISHFSTREKKMKKYKAAVYSIEPYVQGKTIHVLAKCDGDNFVRNFKIERIEKATPAMETYEVPKTFDNSEHFKSAWGIWLGESGKNENVLIKFSLLVSSRVKENIWHQSQKLSDNIDGSITAEFKISEPREMLPWIRGWGKDAEVLEPVWLREMIREDVREMGKIYG